MISGGVREVTWRDADVTIQVKTISKWTENRNRNGNMKQERRQTGITHGRHQPTIWQWEKSAVRFYRWLNELQLECWMRSAGSLIIRNECHAHSHTHTHRTTVTRDKKETMNLWTVTVKSITLQIYAQVSNGLKSSLVGAEDHEISELRLTHRH